MEATYELPALYRGRSEGKNIEWFEIRSDSADHLLRIHDFITGSVGDRAEGIVETEELYGTMRNKNVEEK